MKEWETEEEGAMLERAKADALRILLFKDRTRCELYDKLSSRQSYTDDVIEAAVAYCASFGYVNDRRYAENYVVSMRSRKSRRLIRRELSGKGVADAYIDAAFDSVPFSEEETVRELIAHKAGEPHRMDDRELRRTAAYLARRGYDASMIWKCLRDYQEEAEL